MNCAPVPLYNDRKYFEERLKNYKLKFINSMYGKELTIPELYDIITSEIARPFNVDCIYKMIYPAMQAALQDFVFTCAV